MIRLRKRGRRRRGIKGGHLGSFSSSSFETHRHLHNFTHTHYLHTHTHTHTHTLTHLHTYTLTHLHTYTLTHLHTYTPQSCQSSAQPTGPLPSTMPKPRQTSTQPTVPWRGNIGDGAAKAKQKKSCVIRSCYGFITPSRMTRS
jgi:hypothetical protein